MADRSNSRIGVHHLWFDLVWSAYLITKLLQWAGVKLPELVNSYLTDLLCIPIVLGFSGELLLWCFGKRKAHLSILQILFALIYFSVFFEFVLPRFDLHAIGDPLDVVCYAIGAIAFAFIQEVSIPAKNKLSFLWR